MSDFVGNSKSEFSHDAAHILLGIKGLGVRLSTPVICSIVVIEDRIG